MQIVLIEINSKPINDVRTLQVIVGNEEHSSSWRMGGTERSV